MPPPPAVQFQCSFCGKKRSYPSARPSRCPECGGVDEWEGDILILDSHPSAGEYSEEIYPAVFQAENEGHFWFEHRILVIEAFLRRSLGSLDSRRLLEIGCGTGRVLAHLEAQGMRVNGVDMNLGALRLARTRTKAPLIRSSAVPFKNEFDVVLLCDVLEHVDDERGLLRSCREALKPNGIVLLTVPAHENLWSKADTLAGHKRRYTRSGLISILAQNFDVRFISYFNMAIAPIQYFFRAREERLYGDDHDLNRRDFFARSLKTPPAWLNTSLLGLLSFERAVLSAWSLPIGTSLIATAVAKDLRP